MTKLLTVFGATGKQGGSVINSILSDPILSQEYKLRGITRDVSKPASQALSDRGVEMISADLSSPESLAKALTSSHTVFLVTDFWQHMSRDKEVTQGKTAADACKRAGVRHLIYSSLLDVERETGGKLGNVSHFDGKAEVERYIRGLSAQKEGEEMKATFVMAGFYMSNLFGMIRGDGEGGFVLNWPVSGDGAKVPLFDVDDMGKFVIPAIKAFPSPFTKTIPAASDYYTPNRFITEFSNVTGLPAKFVQISGDVFKSFLPAPVAQEMLENMLLLEEPGGYFGSDGGDLGESVGLVGGGDRGVVSWRAFVEKNKGKWLNE